VKFRNISIGTELMRTLATYGNAIIEKRTGAIAGKPSKNLTMTVKTMSAGITIIP
jgi:hypothetical protein